MFICIILAYQVIQNLKYKAEKQRRSLQAQKVKYSQSASLCSVWASTITLSYFYFILGFPSHNRYFIAFIFNESTIAQACANDGDSKKKKTQICILNEAMSAYRFPSCPFLGIGRNPFFFLNQDLLKNLACISLFRVIYFIMLHRFTKQI